MPRSTSLLRSQPMSRPFRGRLPISRVPAAFLAYCFETLLAWQDRAGMRHHLRSLNDHQLKDIGLTRADVEREACKPFWRV